MKTLRITLFVTLPVIILYAIKFLWFPNFIAHTTSMEPAIRVNDLVWGMRSASFRTGDIVFYSAEREGEEYIVMHRVVAGPGDKLEIKDGIVYLNDTIGDKYWLRKHEYLVAVDNADVIKKALEYKEHFEWIDQVGPGLFLTNLDPEDAIRFSKNSQVKSIERFIHPRGENDMPLYSGNKTGWSIDNYGPYVVPERHYFVMGDNRHNSADSRFTGPVHEDDIQGVIFE